MTFYFGQRYYFDAGYVITIQIVSNAMRNGQIEN
jgi:hypothetical protein